jgi:hypothetical protein
MFPRLLQLLAAGALIATGTVTEASACCGWCGCGWSAPVVAVGPLPPVYVVNQGPVYAGPSIITYPGYFEALAWPRFYPYVSADYGYPWHVGPYYRRAHYVRHYHGPIGPYYK